MPHKINQESKYQFLSTIEMAMDLMDRVGHITDYNELSHVSHMKANELHSFLFSSFDSGITSDDWINAGVPVGELEKVRLYFGWYARLHVAGVYDHDGRAICADCLPEDQWHYALLLQVQKDKQFKVIPRGVPGQSLYCDVCKRIIKI